MNLLSLSKSNIQYTEYALHIFVFQVVFCERTKNGFWRSSYFMAENDVAGHFYCKTFFSKNFLAPEANEEEHYYEDIP